MRLPIIGNRRAANNAARRPLRLEFELGPVHGVVRRSFVARAGRDRARSACQDPIYPPRRDGRFASGQAIAHARLGQQPREHRVVAPRVQVAEQDGRWSQREKQLARRAQLFLPPLGVATVEMRCDHIHALSRAVDDRQDQVAISLAAVVLPGADAEPSM